MIAGTDPVAVEAVCLKVILQKRQACGASPGRCLHRHCVSRWPIEVRPGHQPHGADTARSHRVDRRRAGVRAGNPTHRWGKVRPAEPARKAAPHGIRVGCVCGEFRQGMCVGRCRAHRARIDVRSGFAGLRETDPFQTAGGGKKEGEIADLATLFAWTFRLACGFARSCVGNLGHASSCCWREGVRDRNVVRAGASSFT